MMNSDLHKRSNEDKHAQIEQWSRFFVNNVFQSRYGFNFSFPNIKKCVLDRMIMLTPAAPIYLRFQADIKPNNMSLKWII